MKRCKGVWLQRVSVLFVAAVLFTALTATPAFANNGDINATGGTASGSNYVGSNGTEGNTVTVIDVEGTGGSTDRTGTFSGRVYGGYNSGTTGTDDTNGNTVTLEAGSYTIGTGGGSAVVVGGRNDSDGTDGGGADANNNIVEIKSGVIINGSIVGGYARGSSGTGTTSGGNANYNTVILDGVRVIDAGSVVIGGKGQNAIGNTVNLKNNMTTSAAVIGGQTIGTGINGNATGNTINVTGIGTVSVGDHLSGGHANGAEDTTTGDLVTDNVLNVGDGAGGGMGIILTVAGNIENFANINVKSNATLSGNLMIKTKNANGAGNTVAKRITVDAGGTINVGGIESTIHTTIANSGTINISGAFDNGGTVTNSGSFTANSGITNNGTLNLDGGILINAAGSLTNNGTLNFNGGVVNNNNGNIYLTGSNSTTNFDLEKYTEVAAISGSGTITVGGDKVTLNGGKDNTIYLLTDKNVIRNTSGSVLSDEEISAYLSVGLFDTSIEFKDGKITQKANAEYISENVRNGSIAEELITNRNELQRVRPELYDYLRDEAKKGGAAYRSAVAHTLDGSNSASAQAQLSLNAAYQFNTALGQIFGDSFAANIANGGINTSSLFYRQSAGGRPTGMGSTGASAGYATGFVKAYGGFGSQGSTSSYNGYDFGGAGVLTGLGYKFADELEIGALFGYSWNRAESFGDYGSNTDNVLRFGVYGNYAFDNFFYNTAPTAGIHLIDTVRNSALGSAKSDRTGFDFSWYNRVGYTLELPADFYITPSYALGLSYFNDPAHAEHGGAWTKFGDYDQWSLLQTLEVRVGKLFRVNECFAVLPEFQVGWEHDYINNNNTVAQSVGGNFNYNASIRGLEQDRLLLGVGLTTLIKDKFEVSARYNELVWDGGHLSQFTVEATTKF